MAYIHGLTLKNIEICYLLLEAANLSFAEKAAILYLSWLAHAHSHMAGLRIDTKVLNAITIVK